MYKAIARWCFDHRKLTVVLWLALIVGMNIAQGVVGTDFGGEPEAPDSETNDGFEILSDHFGGIGAGYGGSIVFEAEQGVNDPAVQAAMEELFAVVQADDKVAAVRSPYTGAGGSQINDDGTVAFATVDLFEDVGFGMAGDVGELIQDEAPELAGLRVEVGGEMLAGFEPPESEVIGLGFAIIILIVSFGSVLAMGLPIATALFGVSSGLAGAGLLSNVQMMPDFATVIGAMIGLGVGIDYALFIVTRFRENLALGDSPRDATINAMDTAGRAVVFAGITVVASLLGMLLIGLEFIAGLGVAASVTVLFTMMASMTLLPALLGFAQLKVEITRWRGLLAAGFIATALMAFGLKLPEPIPGLLFLAGLASIVLGFILPPLKREVPRRAKRPLRETGWHRWSRQIQKRPWPFAIGGTLLLLAISAPVLGIRLGFPDEGNFAEETTTRQAYDLLAEGFGPGVNGPMVAIALVDSPEQLQALADVRAAIAADPGVAEAIGPFPNTLSFDADGNITQNPDAELAAGIIQIIPTSAPQDIETEQLIKRLRAEVIPPAESEGVEVLVTGFVAANIDFSEYLGARSLVFFGAVLVISFLLLMMVFRSVLVPIKAVIMNMLSISGAYGVVVAVFQWGWLEDVIGIQAAPIPPYVPMMMFAIVFGLSMDYEVFLLSRIKEEYVRTGDAFNSVADGLAATARVISAAAAIMVVVFGSFLLEDMRETQLFGTGLGLAVLLDATLVRMLLVPATMELLGARNWWIPRWLDRLLPNLNVEGSPAEHVAEAADDAVEPVGVAAATAGLPTAPPVGATVAANGAAEADGSTDSRITADDLTRAVAAVSAAVETPPLAPPPGYVPEPVAADASSTVGVVDEDAVVDEADLDDDWADDDWSGDFDDWEDELGSDFDEATLADVSADSDRSDVASSNGDPEDASIVLVEDDGEPTPVASNGAPLDDVAVEHAVASTGSGASPVVATEDAVAVAMDFAPAVTPIDRERVASDAWTIRIKRS